MAVDLASALPAVYSTVSSETDVTSFCRICATTGSGNLFSIFSQEGELWDVAEKIGRCLPIIVLPTDTLPLNICIQCLMKLNTSYELVITALNSEAKLKARLDFTEDPIQLEAPEGDHLTRVFVKQEEPGTEVKPDLLDTVELPGIYGCEVVISSETGNNEKAEVTDSMMTEVTPDTLRAQNKISERSGGNAESVRLQEECHKSRVEFDIEISNEELLKNSYSETSDGKLMSVEVPSLTIYGPAMCDLCNVTFTDMDEFDSHVVDRHLQKHKWQCLRCDDSFEHPQDLVLHKVVTHGEEPVSCGRCQEGRIKDKNIGNEGIQEGWPEESETHGGENKIYANNNSKDSTEVYCKLCDRNFCDEAKLKDHYLVHSPQPLVCSRCGLKCCSSHELSVHKRNHLRNVKEERYICDVCRKTFFDHVMYNAHRRHCGSKRYMCNLCDRTFWRKYSLQLHMKHGHESGAERKHQILNETRQIWSGDF